MRSSRKESASAQLGVPRRVVLARLAGAGSLAALPVWTAGSSEAADDARDTPIGVPPPRIFLVFVNISGSVTEEDWDIYRTTFESLVKGAKSGDRVLLGRISKPSPVGFLPVADIEFSKTDPIEDARSSLLASFDGLRRVPPSKLRQILDVLKLCQNLIQANAGYRPFIILLSDMIEDSEIARFDVQRLGDAEIEELIARQREGRLLPNLHQAKVYVAGAKAANSEKLDEVRAFWERYFKAAGAISDRGMYGRPPIRFRDEE